MSKYRNVEVERVTKITLPNPFKIMLDPASANALATPRPMPLVEPVTNAILLVNILFFIDVRIFNLSDG